MNAWLNVLYFGHKKVYFSAPNPLSCSIKRREEITNLQLSKLEKNPNDAKTSWKKAHTKLKWRDLAKL